MPATVKDLIAAGVKAAAAQVKVQQHAADTAARIAAASGRPASAEAAPPATAVPPARSLP